MSSNNRNAGRAAILNAPPGEPSNDLNSDGRFEMRPDGLFRRSDDGRPWRVSGPFEVLCETHDDEALAWGLLIRFPDRDQVTQCVVVTRDLFAGEGAELRGLLARRGLFVNPTQAARGALNLYLATLATPKRARVVARTGWHRVGDVRVFVLPDEVFGHAPVEVLYQPASRELSPFRQAGSLAAWRDDVASWCIGNSRLLLAVSAAFAAPLLDVVGEEGGGLHLRGASRIGKTTALRVAASVWGGNVGGGAEAYLRQWRSTSNATEGVAATHSDTLLALDELGQADPREVGATAYMLASGQGKNRMDRAGALRAVARFRSLFLSTGELSLGYKIAEAGSAMKAGQEVRLVDLPADAGAGLGLF